MVGLDIRNGWLLSQGYVRKSLFGEHRELNLRIGRIHTTWYLFNQSDYTDERKILSMLSWPLFLGSASI